MRSLRSLIVAECVERFRVTDRWEFWVDEDGRSAGKPVNQAATRVGRDFGVQFDFLGSVVITGWMTTRKGVRTCPRNRLT